MNKNSSYNSINTESISNIKSVSVRDLPKSERPKRDLLKRCVKTIFMEILSFDIKYRFERRISNDAFSETYNEFGSLSGIMNASLEDLKNVKGLGETKAAKLMACFEFAKRAVNEQSL